MTASGAGKRIVSSLDGDLWHGPSLWELLEDITPEVAVRKPVPNGHSIWEIVLHLTTWVEKAITALDGIVVPKWPFPEDWPAVEGEWITARQNLALAIRRLGTRLESTGDDVLQLIVPGREYSFDYMLDGLVQHSAYHAGQIAMLKRAGETPS
jgi:uncharacterized damage-inducible protein DinB